MYNIKGGKQILTFSRSHSALIISLGSYNNLESNSRSAVLGHTSVSYKAKSVEPYFVIPRKCQFDLKP
ncbi:hypothetical protein VN97_g2837 [Penicillium thymicola]|uniref:Uncharacterized protein n=1 Tax=Penicillium thymicola TaxID=293382 RepID=A0AAI9TNB3_PENTH|nr:hypothetical protein VN97_g2837 [Penicillium thymicola]